MVGLVLVAPRRPCSPPGTCVVTNLTLGAVAELVLLAIWYVLAFNFAMTVLFVFPYLASFEGRTRDVFRNARLMSWKHPLTALAALAIIALCCRRHRVLPAGDRLRPASGS